MSMVTLREQEQFDRDAEDEEGITQEEFDELFGSPSASVVKAKKKVADDRRLEDRRALAGEIDLSGFSSASSDEDKKKVYSAADKLGVSKDQVDAFTQRASDARRARSEIASTGRTATEYGTVGDGSYYSKRDKAARDRNSALAGQRGATITSGLDRQAEMQDTVTGGASTLGRRSRRSLESERGRLRREARQAKKAGFASAANKAYATSLGTKEPANKDDQYRKAEEDQKRKLMRMRRLREEAMEDELRRKISEDPYVGRSYTLTPEAR